MDLPLALFFILISSYLLDACIFSSVTKKVFTRGRLVCRTFNDSIVPIAGVEVQLKDWETLPLPHGLVVVNTTTDSLGYYRVSGSNEKRVSPFKFYVVYRLSCAKDGPRTMCEHLENVCAKLSDGCFYEKTMHTIDDRYYFEENRKHVLYEAHDVDISDRAWEERKHCKHRRSTSPEIYPPGR